MVSIFFFILMILVIEIYCIGSIKKWRLRNSVTSWMDDECVFTRRIVIPTFVVISIFIVVCFKFLIGNSSWYLCEQFIASGQLSDFKNQMVERIEILESAEEDIVLPMMNSEQGPFMHMPLIADPKGYSNIATAKFYNKRSVVAIPRDEWNQKYKNGD